MLMKKRGRRLDFYAVRSARIQASAHGRLDFGTLRIQRLVNLATSQFVNLGLVHQLGESTGDTVSGSHQPNGPTSKMWIP